MKVGILSDTHRIKKVIDKTIPYLKECDLIIHAGDNFSDSKYIREVTNIGIMAVKGNCDFEHVEEELIFEIEDKIVFLCHGDKYGVKYGIDNIELRAKEVNADIVIFGHTHTPLCLEKDKILYINPGSISIPRNAKYGSFIMLNIKNAEINIEEIRI